MKTPGKTLDDHLAKVAKFLPETDVTQISGVQCEADIISSSVFLCYHSEFDRKFPHRPYLHIMGECRAIRGDLPYNVSEITFAENHGIETDFFYEFTDKELSDMAAKGLFHKGFKCPEIFFDNKFELPVVCDFRIVNPKDEKDIPIVFAQIQNANDISISEETCGYTFGDYFEEYEPLPEDMYQSDEVHINESVEKDLYEQEHEQEEEVVETPEVVADDQMLAERYDEIRDRVQARINQSDGITKDEVEQDEIETVEPDDEFIDDSDSLTDDDFVMPDEGRGTPKEVPSKIDDIEAEFIQAEDSAEKE